MSVKSSFLLSFLAVVLVVQLVIPSFASAQERTTDQEVIGAFTEVMQEPGEAVKIEDSQKHQILFYMGILLLVLILATATLGIRMALFGHQLYIPHMICAGATVFLSLAHAVTAVVWFYPF